MTTVPRPHDVLLTCGPAPAWQTDTEFQETGNEPASKA